MQGYLSFNGASQYTANGSMTVSTPTGSDSAVGISNQGGSGSIWNVYGMAISVTGGSSPIAVTTKSSPPTVTTRTYVYGGSVTGSVTGSHSIISAALVITSGGSPAGGGHPYSVPSISVAFQNSGSTVSAVGSVQAFLIGSNGVQGTFTSGTLIQTASSGVATFGDLVVPAGKWTIVFAALGMPNVVSNSFTVT
jgi:hypothetical protein